jgi:uncharacterized membrane protein YphA (DoxX/SURF4 family)
MKPLTYPNWFRHLAVLIGFLCQLAAVGIVAYAIYLIYLFFKSEEQLAYAGHVLSQLVDYFRSLLDGDVVILRFSTPAELQVGIMVLIVFYGLHLFTRGLGLLFSFPGLVFQFGTNLTHVFFKPIQEPPASETPSVEASKDEAQKTSSVKKFVE